MDWRFLFNAHVRSTDEAGAAFLSAPEPFIIRAPGLRPRVTRARVTCRHTEMKTRLMVLLLLSMGVVSAAEDAPKPVPRPRLTEASLRQAVQIPTAVREISAAGISSAADTSEIAPSRVVALNHGMIGHPDGPSPGSRPFTLEEGGTYREWGSQVTTAEMMLQYDPPLKGWDFLKISW